MNWNDFFTKLILFKKSKDENVLSILSALEELDDDCKSNLYFIKCRRNDLNFTCLTKHRALIVPILCSML